MTIKDLNEKAKRMLLSILLADVAGIVVELFLNAFLWRELSSIQSIAIYNLGTIITLPLFFYINGYFLGKYKVAQMYGFGLCGRSLVIALVVFGSELTNTNLFLFGLIYGAFNGFFWANRNYLSMKVTNNHNRIYYSAVENIVATFVNVVIPLVIGWFIVFMDKAGTSIALAYEIIMGVGLVTALLGGIVIFPIEVEKPVFVRNLRFKKSRTWVDFRIATMLEGLMGGVMLFLPTLIILNVVGEEGVLGTITAFSSVLTAIVIYFIGKRAKPRHRKNLVFMSLLLIIIVSAFFGIFYDKTFAVLFRLVSALAVSLYWVIWNPVYYELIERQDEKDSSRNYLYVIDTELFLNIGRFLGMLVTIIALDVYTEKAILRYLPLVLALTQLPMIYYFKRIFKELKQFEIEYQEPIDEVIS